MWTDTLRIKGHKGWLSISHNIAAVSAAVMAPINLCSPGGSVNKRNLVTVRRYLEPIIE